MPIVAGAPIASADVVALANQTIYRPLVRLVASGTQSIPTGVPTAISFTGSEDIDTHNYHSPSVNTSRVTPLLAGYYQVSGFVYITNTTTAVTGGFVGRNGTLVAGGAREGVITTGAARGYYAKADLAANGSTDYFEIFLEHTTGSSVNTNQSGRYSSTFEVEFLRPL